eukprot:scaffold62697_cov57-Phaeocystis_antarctica.AAC.3
MSSASAAARESEAASSKVSSSAAIDAMPRARTTNQEQEATLARRRVRARLRGGVEKPGAMPPHDTEGRSNERPPRAREIADTLRRS